MEYRWRIGAILVLNLVLSHPALAAGFGAYVSVGSGNSDWDARDLNGGDAADISSDFTPMGLGFVFDSAPARDRLFRYRLNAGYQATEIDYEFKVEETIPFGFVAVSLIRCPQKSKPHRCQGEEGGSDPNGLHSTDIGNRTDLLN